MSEFAEFHVGGIGQLEEHERFVQSQLKRYAWHMSTSHGIVFFALEADRYLLLPKSESAIPIGQAELQKWLDENGLSARFEASTAYAVTPTFSRMVLWLLKALPVARIPAACAFVDYALYRYGLRAVVGVLETDEINITGDVVLAGSIIEQFNRYRALYPKSKRCLLDALAIACVARAFHVRFDVVFAVDKDTLGFHGWISSRGVALNEDDQILRQYSPIVALPLREPRGVVYATA
ncbi:MAG: lasso peptide biosynthesis protein [Kaiparowitsia implicata GSE-PSE-MK54-09C]|jgi:hypothetical protein|nr:lasso peptide biosynthesis protein [Kaiparowitsia implicata GSE-PSE-MK54-09C]